VALEAQGRFGEARRQYESLIELFPSYTYAPISVGAMLVEQGKLDEAVRVFDDPELIAADPEAGLRLAHVYANLGMQREVEGVLVSIREPPTAAAVARAARLLLDGEWAELREFAEREYEATSDPLWLNARLLEAILTTDAVSAAAALEALGPLPTDGATSFTRGSAMESLMTAQALRLTGKIAEASRIDETVLRGFESSPGEYTSNEALWIRALAHAALGHNDAAIGELTRATEQGFRTLVDFEYFVRLEDYPFMRDVVSDPRFRELASRIDADNARMREALLAER
jgi:tetratricopeptide (TPR) repeat protein